MHLSVFRIDWRVMCNTKGIILGTIIMGLRFKGQIHGTIRIGARSTKTILPRHEFRITAVTWTCSLPRWRKIVLDVGPSTKDSIMQRNRGTSPGRCVINAPQNIF